MPLSDAIETARARRNAQHPAFAQLPSHNAQTHELYLEGAIPNTLTQHSLAGAAAERQRHRSNDKAVDEHFQQRRNFQHERELAAFQDSTRHTAQVGTQ